MDDCPLLIESVGLITIHSVEKLRFGKPTVRKNALLWYLVLKIRFQAVSCTLFPSKLPRQRATRVFQNIKHFPFRQTVTSIFHSGPKLISKRLKPVASAYG
jgi:hypothetical protein